MAYEARTSEEQGGMTPEEMERIMDTFLKATLKEFTEKSLSYRKKGTDAKDQFLRMTAIKNAIKGIGSLSTFGVGVSDYSACPSGICAGGICYGSAVDITDDHLRRLAQELGVTPQELAGAGERG